MITGDVDEFLVPGKTKCSASFEVDQGILVVAGLEFAKAEHGPRRSKLRIESGQVAEGGERFRVVVRLVVYCSHVPPAFVPAWIQFQRFLVEHKSFGKTVCLALC